jgi:CheY-like chemotaxis protein/HPt (histidine-containing phosphotransfer) domain-containing protein
MGGTIQLIHPQGGGSIFQLSLVFPECPAPLPAVPSSLSQADPESRILFTEDNRLNRMVGLEMIRSLGFRNIDVAVNGKEACQLCLQDRYDIVFLDCSMPVMDGFEASQFLRNSPDISPALPIVAMTAYASAEDRRKCLASGMTDFLPKPIQETELSQILQRHLPESSGPSPAFDRTAALQQMGGKSALFEQALTIAVEDIPMFMQEIESLLKVSDFTGLRAAGHKLLGSLSILHARQCLSLARQFHESASSQNQAWTTESFQSLRPSIISLLAELRQAQKKN